MFLLCICFACVLCLFLEIVYNDEPVLREKLTGVLPQWRGGCKVTDLQMILKITDLEELWRVNTP